MRDLTVNLKRTSLAIAALVLAACGSESTEFPEDGRPVTEVSNGDVMVLSGRVIDDYLRDATVWLDLNGNGLFDTGEPNAVTGAAGRFNMDISAIFSDIGVAPDLNPNDFPLVAVTIPGKTVDERPSGDVTLSHGYFLMAPPGIRNITPLTTLVEMERRLGLNIGERDAAQATLDALRDFGRSDIEGNAPRSVNLLADYLANPDARAAAYGRALARYLSLQTSAATDAQLSASGDGLVQAFSVEAIAAIGRAFLRDAPGIADQVDAAAVGGNFAAVDEASLDIVTLGLDLNDPWVVVQQNVFVKKADPVVLLPGDDQGIASENRLKGSFASAFNLRLAENKSAVIRFEYDVAGRPTLIEADGLLAPSLIELARLVNANGQFGAVGTQWREGFDWQANNGALLDGVPDERLIFDWQAGTIKLDSKVRFATATGTLDGAPEILYSWTKTNGLVDSLTENFQSAAPAFVDRTLAVAYHSGGDVASYAISRASDGQLLESWSFTAPDPSDSCAAQIDTLTSAPFSGPRLIGKIRPQTYARPLQALPSNALSGVLSWAFNTESGRNHLLRAPFFDTVFEPTRWLQNEYDYILSGDGFSTAQPNLLKSSTVSQAVLVDCGKRQDLANNFYAVADYQYKRLSIVLTEQAAALLTP